MAEETLLSKFSVQRFNGLMLGQCIFVFFPLTSFLSLLYK